MNNGLIAARYATALLGFANQSNATQKVYTEAKAIVQSYFQFTELRQALDNPVLSKTEKQKIISLAAGGNLSKSFGRFIEILLENNREVHLQSIALKYIDLYRKENNIHHGKLITATTVEASVEKRLLAMMQHATGGTVEIEKVINPALLGGFQLEVDFVRWDASLAGQLQRIRNEYLEQNKKVL
jgi:F-type H+-transporting ATPase subunit delta